MTISSYVPTVASNAVENAEDMLLRKTNDQTMGQSKYDFTQRTFPSDLGTGYNGHYMVININVQNTTQMASFGSQNNQKQISTPISGEKSVVDVVKGQLEPNLYGGRLSYENDFRGGPAATPASSQNQESYINRPTTRIKESIAIFMPNSELTFTDKHEFDNISLTKFAGSFITGGAKFLAAVGGMAFTRSLTATDKLVDAAGKITGATGDMISSVGQVLGTPINPKVEVLYSNTNLRQFAFDFLFAPANEQDSLALEQIIKTLRFHAAPEIIPGFVSSFFFTPPSEFDITFYNRGKKNDKIPSILTCVLEQIDVSYSPAGAYATFHNGYPVQVRMMLQFREVEVIDKQRIALGF
jgi:hypothetical protein